ncbi:hypothetical protein T440DRAFT_557082 [Plenodomus tracheiphilus IPT5]|uniref:Uncharacterized protein n=1 Tax=Plenodomus tracheiphilus IPT5 TaxID=1408161 RepID=A0A6A7AXK0_9PLEO|nr:hypothetical protein T440DRAFT_557082 [Plenodomus tracheiphilus IPT5]
MANQRRKVPITQSHQATVHVSTNEANEDPHIQSSQPQRPTLKRSRKYTLQNSFSNTFKRQRTSTGRSRSADYPPSSLPFFETGILEPSYSKTPTPPDSVLIQHGTSRRTSVVSQFLQQLTRPIKRLPSRSKSNKTTVVIPHHLRGRAIPTDSCLTSIRYSDHDSQHHIYNDLAHFGMASIPDAHSYLNESPVAGPSNYYDRPDYRNFRARRKLPLGRDVFGNPLIPTSDTNREASTESTRWSGLQPGTPGLAHQFSYFPLHPSNENPLRALTPLVPRVPKNSPERGNRLTIALPNYDYAWGFPHRYMSNVSLSDENLNLTGTELSETPNRFNYSDLSDQLSDLELPLSMPTGKGYRMLPIHSILKKTARRSAPSLATPFGTTASYRSPSEITLPFSEDGDSGRYDADDDADDDSGISSDSDEWPPQPTNIPSHPAQDGRRSSLRRMPSIEQLRALSISTQTFTSTRARQDASPPARHAFEGPRSRVCSTIRLVEVGDQEDDEL